MKFQKNNKMTNFSYLLFNINGIFNFLQIGFKTMCTFEQIFLYSMKQLLYSILITLLLSISINSTQAQYRAGVQLSATTNILNADSIPAYMVPGFGYTIGVSFNYSFHRFFGIQAEVLYSNKSFKQEDIHTYYYEYFNYIEVPIFMKMNFGRKKSSIRWMVDAGIAPSRMLSANYEGKLSGQVMRGDIDIYDSRNHIYLYQASFILGGGIAYERLSDRMMLGLRITNGLTNIYKHHLNPKHFSIGISLGYQLNLGNQTKNIKPMLNKIEAE